MDLRKIKTLIELLEASDLSEIEISEGDDSIRLSRQITAVAPVAAVAAPAVTIAAAAVQRHQQRLLSLVMVLNHLRLVPIIHVLAQTLRHLFLSVMM